MRQPTLIRDIIPTLQHQLTTPRRTVYAGIIRAGKWEQHGIHNFCEYCGKYTLGHDFTCPHCQKEQP